MPSPTKSSDAESWPSSWAVSALTPSSYIAWAPARLMDAWLS
ncbi:hypothetical protein ACN28E_25225 [Archangium lansingense]